MSGHIDEENAKSAAVPEPRRRTGRRGATSAVPSRRRSPRLPAGPAFVVAATALVLVFFCSGTPVPLYITYREQFGVTSGDLALTTVLYLATTAVSLLFLGRLSDVLGRRPVAVVAVTLSLLGALVLTQVDGAGVLVIGRMLQGIACGLASSTLGAYVVELAPERPRWLAPVITGNAPAFSIPIGALLAGSLVQYGPQPRHLVFWIVAAALLVCGILLFGCRETVQRNGGSALATLRPKVRLPRGRRLTVVAVFAAIVATWSLSGFFQAFSPTLTADQLGSDNALLSAVVFASIVVLAPVGGALTGSVRPLTALALGGVVFLIATIGIVLGVHAGSAGLLLGSSFPGGVALGIIGSAGMRAMLAHSAPSHRAGVIATVYLISYSGAAVPGLVFGQLSHVLSLADVSTAYGLLVVVALIVSLISLSLLRPSATEQVEDRR